MNINVASSDLAGGAIGLMVNNAKAENITVGGSIVGNDGVGGIVGRLIISGTISSCTNNASVTSSYGGIGGIVGKAYYEDGANTALFASVDKCVNNGIITAPMYMGGIVGLARANVTGCINNGVVVGGTQTGGIVGQLIAAGTVSNNENNAKISGKNHLGGIIGDYSQSTAYTYYNVTIANNINRGELAATEQCAAILGCNNIDGFTAMTASGNVSFYYAEGLVLFGNPEDMVIDSTNMFNPAMTLSDFVQKVVAGNGVFDGNGATVQITPVSGDARTETKEGLPDRLQKYTNPEVYYAQYQRFGDLTDVFISNVKFVFVPAAVTVVDAWNTAGATTTADNINGELQLLNTGNVTLTGCSFDKMSVSPINATAVSVSACSFNGLDAYAIKDIKASTVTVADTTFTDCNGGFWMNAAPAVLSVTGNTFANVGRRGAIQFSANGDYSSAEMTVTDNTVTGGAFLWLLNPTVTYEQVSAILDTTENTYGTAYVSGSVEPKPPVAKIGDVTYATLEAAFAAATEGQTITLLSDATWTKDYGTGAPTIASVIDLGGKTLTIADGNIRFSTITLKNGNIVIDPAGSYSGNGVFYMFDEKVLTLDNVKLTAENFTGYSIFCMEGNSDLVLQNGTEITVKNANVYGVVAAVSEGEVTIDNAKITGETITGRGFLNGNYTIKGTSEIMLTGVTKDGFYIGAGDTLNIQDTAKVAITLNADGDNRYGINISTATSTYTKADTATVTATFYAPAVAKIGDTPYTTLEAALNAAKAGDTVEIVVAGNYELKNNYVEEGAYRLPDNFTLKGIVDGVVVTNGPTIRANNLTIDNVDFNNPVQKNYQSGLVFYLTGDSVIKNSDIYGYWGASYYSVVTGTLLVDNCTFDTQVYGLHIAEGNADVTVKNSVIAGWNTYGSDIRVTFTGCTFKDNRGYHYLGFYGDAVIEDCKFEENVTIGSQTTDAIVIDISNSKVVDDNGDEIAEKSIYDIIEQETLDSDVVVKIDNIHVNGKVAKIGETTYATLVDALAAAQTGDTVVLLADASVEGTAQIPAGVTIKSNGYKILGSIRMLGDLTLDGSLEITGGLWVGKPGETLTATLSGDKLTASYFMFQCGTYTINADIDAVYGYLSFEATFEVNSTIHTTGANGEVLYINGNVTLNDGAVLDSDNSVFVCNDNAVLTLKAGSKVDSNVRITKSGAKVYVDATGMTAGATANITGTVANTGNGTIAVVGNDKLEASIVDGKIVLAAKPVAKIGDTTYATIVDAFKAATEGCTIEILSDVTIDYKWDCRDYATGGSHSQFKESVTINGNGHTLKFTGTVNDSNWNTIFRFEENATVNNLTVDISEATGAQRVISAKKSLTVNGLTIVGSAKYGIIFGEGASADDLAESEIVVTNSSLTGTRRAISDNENGKDVKSVVITGTTLKANVNVSAYDLVTFSNNTVEGGYVDIRSYTADAKLDVTAIGNTLTANTEAKYNYVKASGTLNVQSEFVLPPYGTLTNCYTSEIGYWGECGGNAKESFVFKFYNDDTYMGYTSLNNVGGIIDGDVNVSWNIKLDVASNTDEYWTMAWEVQPTLAMQPNRCEQWVDGVKVAECAVEPNWSDRIFPVVAAVTDEKGQILSYVNNHESATMANAVANGGYVTLLADVKIDASLDLPADKTLTLDLNGKKISGSAVLNNAGDLTIRDSSAEKDATNELAIVNTGKLAISSGHFAGAISGEGEFAITGGTYVQNVADYCAEGYLCAEQNCVPVLWKVGRLPSAEVINLGPVEVGPEGDFTFGDNYYVYDLVGTQKMTTSTEPFDLQIALNFIAKDTVAQAEKNAFGNYTTDFYITIDDIADGSFVADEDCYLAGYYPSFNAWVKIPLTGFEIVDGKVYPVITSAGFDFKYTDICGSVGDFICGIHLSDAVLQANPALKVKLELGLSKTYNEALAADKFIGVDQPYEYDVEDMTSAVAVTGPDYYTTVTGAVEVAVQTGDFVKLVTDANLDDNLAVESNLVINLGGNTLAADGKTLTIADSVVTITNGTLSAFTKDNVTLSGNAILTVTDKVVADSFCTEANYYVSQNANGTHSIMLKSAFRVFITMVDGEPRIGFFKDCDTERAPTAYAIKGATNLETPEWADVDYETATDAAAASELPLRWVKPTEGSEFRFFKLLAE